MTGEVAVSIVIVSYNAPEWTARCLDALASEGRPSVPHEVIVVDSGSAPAARDALRARDDDALVLLLEDNVGFARGCNVGVAHATGEWVLLLNPDAVVEPGAVDALVAFGRATPRAGVSGGRTVSPAGVTDPRSCFGRPTLFSLFCFATCLSNAFAGSAVLDPESLGAWQRDTVREVDVVSGAFFLVPRALWEHLGGLDEQFFMYGEDAEFCLRVRDLGYHPAFTPDAVVLHANGASSGARPAKQILLMQGKVTLARKRWSGVRGRLAVGLLRTGARVRAAIERRSSREPEWTVVWEQRRQWRDGYPAQRPVRPGLELVDRRGAGRS